MLTLLISVAADRYDAFKTTIRKSSHLPVDMYVIGRGRVATPTGKWKVNEGFWYREAKRLANIGFDARLTRKIFN